MELISSCRPSSTHFNGKKTQFKRFFDRITASHVEIPKKNSIITFFGSNHDGKDNFQVEEKKFEFFNHSKTKNKPSKSRANRLKLDLKLRDLCSFRKKAIT